jgi:hypothetical protein
MAPDQTIVPQPGEQSDVSPPTIEPARKAKAGSKLDRIIALLRRPEGASLTELCSATGWQEHSVRGAVARSLKRRGEYATSERIEGPRRYRIEARP